MNPIAPPTARDVLLDQQVCFALYAASLWMGKLYKPLLGPLSLTYPQYIALLALWEHDGVTVSQLGTRLGLDSGTLTPLLKRLESPGWLTRQRDATDERRVLIRLTDSGRALRERARHIPGCVVQSSGCSPQVLRAVFDALQALRPPSPATQGT